MPKLNEIPRDQWLKIWKSRIEIDCAKHKKKVLDWADKVLQEYTGDFRSDKDTGESFKQVCQVIMSVEETIQPHLFYQNPTLIAKAKRNKTAWDKREDAVESVVNHYYRAVGDGGYGIELENELAVLDARLIGYGCTETRYEVEGEFLEEQEDPENPIDKIKDFLTGAEKPTVRTPVITNEKGQITEHLSPLDVVLDSTAKHITKQKRVIKKVDFSLDDLKSVKYDQDIVAKLKPTNVYNDKIAGMSDDDKRKYAEENPDYKGFRGYELHDLENRVIHTLIHGCEDFIEFGTPYPIKEGCTINFLFFIEAPEEVYPLPPLKFYRKRALEFSYIYSQVSDQIDKFLPRIGVDINKLSKAEQIKFENGNLGTMFATNGNPDNAITVFNAPVQQDLFKYMAMIKELMNLESASNDYELSSPEKRKATEANMIDQGTKARRFKPKKRVAGFIKSQAHTIWQTARDNAPYEEFVEILGEEEAAEWWNDPETGKQAWEGEESAGDYWFDFDVDSVAPIDKEMRVVENEKKMDMVLNPALSQKLLEEGKVLLISPVFEQYAKDNLGINDITKIVRDQQIPTADEEHGLWMQGQYPDISEDEANNPKLLMEHFQKHTAFLTSPGFSTVNPQIKEMAARHRDSYIPIIQKMQAQQKPKGAKSA